MTVVKQKEIGMLTSSKSHNSCFSTLKICHFDSKAKHLDNTWVTLVPPLTFQSFFPYDVIYIYNIFEGIGWDN